MGKILRQKTHEQACAPGRTRWLKILPKADLIFDPETGQDAPRTWAGFRAQKLGRISRPENGHARSIPTRARTPAHFLGAKSCPFSGREILPSFWARPAQFQGRKSCPPLVRFSTIWFDLGHTPARAFSGAISCQFLGSSWVPDETFCAPLLGSRIASGHGQTFGSVQARGGGNG